MKKLICILLILCMALSLCACGKFRYGINAVEVLVEQDYYLAFRNNDPLCQAGRRPGKAGPARAAGSDRRT